MPEERKANEIAVGGGGVSVAITHFPIEQKWPVGPLIEVGMRDGVLWHIDRYMHASALTLSHPGVCCCCLAAYGDAVRLEFDLAMQGNDLKRALQCLITMSNSRDIGHETAGLDLMNILNVSSKKEIL
ncbi:hypothetical protein Ancab_021464 [Ancistrocladus abbreviatus]